MHIRTATNKDSEAVKQVVQAALADYGLKYDSGCTDADLDDIEANYLSCGGTFEVVEDDEGHVVGSAGLRPHGPQRCELRKLFLLKRIRGRGIGKQLLERIIAFAREHDFQVIELETSSKLPEALALYRQYGFSPYTPQHYSPRCDLAFELVL